MTGSWFNVCFLVSNAVVGLDSETTVRVRSQSISRIFRHRLRSLFLYWLVLRLRRRDQMAAAADPVVPGDIAGPADAADIASERRVVGSINLTGCRHPVGRSLIDVLVNRWPDLFLSVNRAAEEVGLKAISGTGKGNIIWVERPVMSEELSQLAILQVCVRVLFCGQLLTFSHRHSETEPISWYVLRLFNKLGLIVESGMKETVNKCALGRLLNFYKELFPTEFKFFPRTWCVSLSLSFFVSSFLVFALFASLSSIRLFCSCLACARFQSCLPSRTPFAPLNNASLLSLLLFSSLPSLTHQTHTQVLSSEHTAAAQWLAAKERNQTRRRTPVKPDAAARRRHSFGAARG